MTGDSRRAGGGTLFTEPILVVNQKARLVETVSEFGVFDQYGHPLGAVAEVGQSLFRKAVRLLTNYDRQLSHRFEVRDVGGSVVLKVTRPAKMVRSRFLVTRPDDSPIGEINQENVFGKIRFSFTARGEPVGELRAENWRAWNFTITDRAGAEVARITKTFAGYLEEAFTTADNYVVEVHGHLADPLASMVVASALTVDTALKQGEGDT
ncbi:scramblase [Amycolatopsis rhizosphaerae]|uniref:Scramblase n=1 Tax=Amycolatopsis rhizosphaerae TaxID=2053003 RepID=A0A558DPE2_9PSEU|nr:phospholipid scramblase-related protein [Amycolatopsis rhizosphaerae]TVT62909.1 scramblase [Amycolatopsis rhizosphaerae]